MPTWKPSVYVPPLNSSLFPGAFYPFLWGGDRRNLLKTRILVIVGGVRTSIRGGNLSSELPCAVAWIALSKKKRYVWDSLGKCSQAPRHARLVSPSADIMLLTSRAEGLGPVFQDKPDGNQAKPQVLHVAWTWQTGAGWPHLGDVLMRKKETAQRMAGGGTESLRGPCACHLPTGRSHVCDLEMAWCGPTGPPVLAGGNANLCSHLATQFGVFFQNWTHSQQSRSLVFTQRSWKPRSTANLHAALHTGFMHCCQN